MLHKPFKFFILSQIILVRTDKYCLSRNYLFGVDVKARFRRMPISAKVDKVVEWAHHHVPEKQRESVFKAVRELAGKKRKSMGSRDAQLKRLNEVRRVKKLE